jgi:hypothetical protein
VTTDQWGNHRYRPKTGQKPVGAIGEKRR